MKKSKCLVIGLASVLCFGGLLYSCNNNTAVESYYVIDTGSIKTEMLVNSTIILNPKFTDLGEVVTPKYSVEIDFSDSDVTSDVYNEETKVFAPTEVGQYDVIFKVLNDDGTVYKTSDGSTFYKKITIDVVIQSFAAVDSEGSDVSVSSEGVITFGESFTKGSAKKTSNQYKVTGVSFEGSYSITYELDNITPSSEYSDPSLYFGWNKNWKENNDDCFKLSTANGTMATWIWGSDGDIANLSINRTQGWSKGGWWDAPGSVSSSAPLTSGKHELTFERYLNNIKNTCIFGIKFDSQPFTYLNVGDAYTDLLTNVWVESNNTSGSIRVKEYKNISDNEAPEASMSFKGTHYVGDTVNLNNAVKLSDNSGYGNVLVPTFKVYDKNNEECEVLNNTFTPSEAGEYRVVAVVDDLAMNETVVEETLTIEEEVLDGTVIDVSETTPVAMDKSGVILYASARKNGENQAIKSIKCFDSNDNDVTSTTIFKYTSKDGTMSYNYFKADSGVYRLVFEAEDGTTKEKEINVSNKNTVVYGFTYYDLTTLIYHDKFIVGNDTIIYLNNTGTDKQTVKLGVSTKCIYNWTIEFKITDINYPSQGKFFITKNTINDGGSSVSWEDLSVGGQSKADGSPDLWGFESNVYGSGWISYEWRSVWQAPVTDEFEPYPGDTTKGCARESSGYDQYATGTHAYKIACSMDSDGKVTYTYYIDNEVEVIHHTKTSHDNANGVDFYQFSGEHFNGIVTDLRVY